LLFLPPVNVRVGHWLGLGNGAPWSGVEDELLVVWGGLTPLALGPKTILPHVPITLEKSYELTYTYLFNCNVNI